MTCTQPSLSADTVLGRNLTSASFKMSVESVTGAVLSIASTDNLLFVSVAQHGIIVYRVDGSNVVFTGELAGINRNCYGLTANDKHLIYLMSVDGSWSVNVHSLKSLPISIDTHWSSQQKSLVIQQPAPFTLLSTPPLLAIGGAAWMSSWTSDLTKDKQLAGVTECDIVVVDMESMQVINVWKAVDHCVSLVHSDGKLLGVADSCSGIKVYQLAAAPPNLSFTLLYTIDVDEVRSFQLVGSCVAVFHRFEPNISFWNVTEQRTVLCISVQDQARQVAQEFTEPLPDCDGVDEDLLVEDDDHVTAVSSVNLDSDQLLVYGTVSGCVFGMSVQRRTKVFSIPCPHVDLNTDNSVLAVTFLPSGQLITAYQGRSDLTLLNFGLDNPPHRPPTRCGLRRDKTI